MRVLLSCFQFRVPIIYRVFMVQPSPAGQPVCGRDALDGFLHNRPTEASMLSLAVGEAAMQKVL